jgi:hypothetical protein
LKVIVASSDGWSWVLAWAQLGVANVVCVPLSLEAKDQLTWVIKVLTGTVITLVSSPGGIQSVGSSVISFHQGGIEGVDRLADFLIANQSALSLLCSFDSMGLNALQRILGFHIEATELRHQRLGGLTTAHLHVGWYPSTMVIQPGRCQNPSQPLNAFLEPAVKLREWHFA